MNDINALYAALLEALSNADLLVKEIDAEFGTNLASQVSLTLPPTPPVVGAPPAGGPVYGANGLTAPDADGMVQIKAVEDFRTAHAADPLASVRNLASGLKSRWFIQDTLDSPGNLSADVLFQVQTQTNAARTMLSMLNGSGRTSFYQPVFHATKSATGLYKQGDVIPDGGAFAGDFVIAGITVWKGVRAADVPGILATQLTRAQKQQTINNQ